MNNEKPFDVEVIPFRPQLLKCDGYNVAEHRECSVEAIRDVWQKWGGKCPVCKNVKGVY